MAPKTISDLFKFYYEYVKPLYSSVQINNSLPVEVLFELNAALDHLSRKWQYNETEETVVSKAYSHLKRACLDIFKLNIKRASDQYKELRAIDTSIIDNGDFDKKLLKLYNEIKEGAREARSLEGDKRNDTDENVKAFEYWQPIYEMTIQLEKEFYLHSAIEWAKKRSKIFTIKGFVISILASFIAGIFSKEFFTSVKNYILDYFK